MLNIFRKGATSKVMLVILGIGLFAIVATGFGTDGMGGLGGAGPATAGDTLVEVADQKITSTEVSDQVDRQLDRLRQSDPSIDLARLFAEGGYETIIDQLVNTRAMLAFGREQGLGASKRMVDAEIASIPAFENLAGQFDQGAFQRALQSERITEQQLREDIASTLIQRQIMVPVVGSPHVPETMAQRYAALLLEQRSGSVGLVSAKSMAGGDAPTDAEINAFYARNQARYAVPERRTVRYALFGADQVAAAAQPSEAEIQAAYREGQAKYGAQETRSLSQVILPSEAEARALSQRLAGGTRLEQAAGGNLIRLQNQQRAAFERLASAAVANAAFSAAEGTTTQPVRSPLGFHIVRVDAINRKPATPIENVRAELVAQVGERKRQDALAALVTKIEDALGEGASLEEVAQANGLSVVETPAVTATGANPAAPDQALAAELRPLLRPAFELTADEDPLVETLSPTQFAIMKVGQIIPAAPPALAQIRDRVRADLIRDRASARARQLAQQLADRINRGTAPAQAFAGAGVPVQSQRISARRIDIARPGQPVPPPLVMMFSLPKGRARILEAPNGAGWFVVHTETTVPGNAAGQPQLVQATRTQFERILGEEYGAQFARAVQTGLEVERNEAKIRSLKQQLQSGAAPVQ